MTAAGASLASATSPSGLLELRTAVGRATSRATPWSVTPISTPSSPSSIARPATSSSASSRPAPPKPLGVPSLSCVRPLVHPHRHCGRATGARFYFATPHHSWERGTSENTNGLLRQYLPKKTSMATLSQRACIQLARLLNSRPRKRLGYLTPAECYDNSHP